MDYELTVWEAATEQWKLFTQKVEDPTMVSRVIPVPCLAMNRETPLPKLGAQFFDSSLLSARLASARGSVEQHDIRDMASVARLVVAKKSQRRPRHSLAIDKAWAARPCVTLVWVIVDGDPSDQDR